MSMSLIGTYRTGNDPPFCEENFPMSTGCTSFTWRIHYSKIDSMEAYRSIRYAPMNHSHIPSFPNCLPHIDWQENMPKFKHEEGDDDVVHLIKFHVPIHKLKVKLHEYHLMKMFMATLQGDVRSWYEMFQPDRLYSLKDF